MELRQNLRPDGKLRIRMGVSEQGERRIRALLPRSGSSRLQTPIVGVRVMVDEYQQVSFRSDRVYFYHQTTGRVLSQRKLGLELPPAFMEALTRLVEEDIVSVRVEGDRVLSTVRDSGLFVTSPEGEVFRRYFRSEERG